MLCISPAVRGLEDFRALWWTSAHFYFILSKAACSSNGSCTAPECLCLLICSPQAFRRADREQASFPFAVGNAHQPTAKCWYTLAAAGHFLFSYTLFPPHHLLWTQQPVWKHHLNINHLLLWLFKRWCCKDRQHRGRTNSHNHWWSGSFKPILYSCCL